MLYHQVATQLRFVVIAAICHAFLDEKAAHLKYNDFVLQFDSWENDVG